MHLDSIQADRKLLIGGGVTRGMGAGGRPEIGERCAEISEQELRNQIGDADLTFITVGLGGGTGTGVANRSPYQPNRVVPQCNPHRANCRVPPGQAAR